MSRRGGPIDRRLLRRGAAVRRFVVAVAAAGVLATAAVAVQAVVVGRVVAGAFLARPGAAPVAGSGSGASGHGLAWAAPWLGLVAGLVAWRALLAWAAEWAGHRTAAGVKAGLRADLVAAVLHLAPSGRLPVPAGELAVTAGRGLDALDPYLSRYVPQMLVAALAPLGLLAWMASVDLVSAAAVVVVVAMVPVFGALLGLAARSRAERQWKAVAALGGHFLDMVQGLTTLRSLGRAGAQADGIAAAGDALRRRTMATLRVAFLSALAMEVLAAVGTALVAVTLGLRLMDGRAALAPALAVLIVTPEVFLPIRQAGAQFHASVEGMAALDTVFAVIDRAMPTDGPTVDGPTVDGPTVERPAVDVPAPDSAVPGARLTAAAAHNPAARPPLVSFRSASVSFPGRSRPALDRVDLVIAPAERLLVVGPSGAGKTTLLNVLLGFTALTGGRVLVDGADLAGLEPAGWRRRVAWVPQRAHLFTATVADNIALGAPDAPRSAVEAAAAAAGALEFIEALPDGFGTLLGENGAELSGGERQRMALARAFLRDAPLLLMDEPTASLDQATESAVRAAARRLMRGRTVIISSHRPAWTGDVDRVVRLSEGSLAEMVSS